MSSLNRVFLMGNLTRDPELRTLPSGTSVCNFGLAVNRRYTTSSGEDREEVCFVDIEAWGRQAETTAKFLSKGRPALIEGRLKQDRWEDSETGQSRSRMLVRADRVQFLSSGGGGGGDGGGSQGGGGGSSRQEDRGFSGNPQSQQSQPPQQQPRKNEPDENPYEEINQDEDDIPF